MKILNNIRNFFKTDKVYYFAYGSNMSQKRLEKRVGKVRKIGVRTLEGFKLTFDYGNKESSFANIKLDDNSFIQGVVYELTYKQLKTLDYYEGYPLFYERMTDFSKEDNIMVEVYINNRKREKKNRPTSSDYKSTLVDGILENEGWNKDYTESIKLLPVLQINNMYT